MTDVGALAATLQHLQRRPRMHIFDERFTTFVAYIDGLEAGGQLCREFSDWLAHGYLGGESSQHWAGLICDRFFRDEPKTATFLGDLDEPASAPLVREMFDRWAEFLADRQGT